MPRSYGAPELRERPPPAPAVATRPIEPDHPTWLDGVPIEFEHQLPGLHVLQRTTDGAWDTRVVSAAPWPDDWRLPAESRKRGSPLLGVGVASVVAGSATAVGTYLAAHSLPPGSDASPYIVGNSVGWSVAAAGVGFGIAWGVAR